MNCLRVHIQHNNPWLAGQSSGVERVILQHPDVFDVYVIAVELENNSDEVPRAFIVYRPDR